MNFHGIELLGTEPNSSLEEKETSSSRVYALHKTSHKGISRRSRASDGKEMYKKRDHVQSCCFAN